MAVSQFLNSSPVGCSTSSVFVMLGGSLVPSACLWMNIMEEEQDLEFGEENNALGSWGTKFER